MITAVWLLPLVWTPAETKVLASPACNEAGIGKAGLAIRLTEPDLPPVFAHVLPLTGSDFRTRLQPAGRCGRIHRCATGRAGWRGALAAAFGLTPAKTKMLASLFAGCTLNETATTLDITRPTAKTHLPEDRGDAPSRADASMDGADLPDRIEYVIEKTARREQAAS